MVCDPEVTGARVAGVSPDAPGPGGGVDDENILTHVVPLAQAHAWLQQQQAQGKAICSRVYAALYWLSCEAVAD